MTVFEGVKYLVSITLYLFIYFFDVTKDNNLFLSFSGEKPWEYEEKNPSDIDGLLLNTLFFRVILFNPI